MNPFPITVQCGRHSNHRQSANQAGFDLDEGEFSTPLGQARFATMFRADIAGLYREIHAVI